MRLSPGTSNGPAVRLSPACAPQQPAPHPHPLPLRMRIKARAAPGLDAPTAHSLRRLSEHKLLSSRCSLAKAILIQNALPLLNRYNAEMLPSPPTQPAEPEAETAEAETAEAAEPQAPAYATATTAATALDAADCHNVEEATPTAATVTASLPPPVFHEASSRGAVTGAPRRPRLPVARSRRHHQADPDHDVDPDLDLSAGDSSDSDEGDGAVFGDGSVNVVVGPTAAPFDEFDDVFDILDPRPLVASPDGGAAEGRPASAPATPGPASASASASLPRLAKRPASCCGFASSSTMDEEADGADAANAKRAKRACGTDHMAPTRQPFAALACV